MKKGIIIYYSFEGTTKFVAETLAKKLGFDLLKLEPTEELKTKGFMKYVWGGAQVFMKKEPTLKKYELEREKYDKIVIASPVWAGTYTPPFKTFLKNEKKFLTNKSIGLVACHDGGLGKIFSHFEKDLTNNQLIGELHLERAMRNKRETEKLIDYWIEESF